MPIAAPRICTYPGCNTLVLAGRCAKHKPKKGTKRRRYPPNWNRIRKTVLAETPFCQYRTHCRGAPAIEVDHVDNNRMNINRDNLIACCKRCHSHKTATVDMNRDDGGRFLTPAPRRGG